MNTINKTYHQTCVHHSMVSTLQLMHSPKQEGTFVPLQLLFYCAQLLLERRSQLIHLHHWLTCFGYSITWVGHSYNADHRRTHRRSWRDDEEVDSNRNMRLNLDCSPAPGWGAEIDPRPAVQSGSCLLKTCITRSYVRLYPGSVVSSLYMCRISVGQPCAFQ